MRTRYSSDRNISRYARRPSRLARNITSDDRNGTQHRHPGPKIQHAAGPTMMSSATPGAALSMAKTTRCPLLVSTRQLTATSVGSKSRSGIGIKTVPWRLVLPLAWGHLQLESDIVLHATAQLADEIENLAHDAVALADGVIDGAGLRLV
ncbi:hypothetical protein MYBA111488_20780 [Mycobacterium basiliense]